MMNKQMRLCAAIAGGLACTLAHAQNQVTLYGLIEPTISEYNHANAAGAHAVNYQAPWFSGSRFGMTGGHTFESNPGGLGLSGIFKLEAEYVPQNGAMGSSNIIFNRDAWAGFQSPLLGKLTFGRQDALGRDFSAIYGDPYGSANVTVEEGGYTNQNNFKQAVTYGGSATGTRMDNGIVWKKAFDFGLVAGVGFQFGGNVGNLQKGQTKSVALGYNMGPAHVAGFYTHANVANRTDNVWSLGGDYDFGVARVNAGYYHYTGNQGAAPQRRDNVWTISGKVPVGNLDLTLGYLDINAHHAGVANPAAPAAATNFVLNPFADTSSITGTVSGQRKTVYGAAMYHLDKMSDVYVAADSMKLQGQYRDSHAPNATTQTEVAVGLRYKF